MHSSSENNPKQSLLNKKTPRDTDTSSSSTNFRILEPYRSLGLITSSLSPKYFKRGTDRFILTSNSKSFLVYNLDKLRLERISPPSGEITAIAVYKQKVLTAMNSNVIMWDKIHIEKEFGKENNDIITDIMTFDDVLIFTNVKGTLFIYQIYSGVLIDKLELRIAKMIHPLSYFNRILFSKIPEQYEIDLQYKNYTADLVLYNINTQKEIFNFKKENIFPKETTICLIEQSPIIDAVAVAFESGDIIIMNLKTAKIILSLKSVSKPISMSFSTSLSLKRSLLATSNGNAITLWDLNEKKSFYLIDIGDIDYNIMFLPNEPIMIASSDRDNSIKMFKFDESTCIPSLLKQRKGHKCPPKKIRFYGESVNNECDRILSCDETTMRNMSMINEHNSLEFSFKKVYDKIFKNNKLNRKIIDFAYNEFRERDWANVAVIISDYDTPVLLSSDTNSITPNQPKLKTKSKCTSIEISMCGNFGFVGFENGDIECFNMQSGNSKWVLTKAHQSAVTNIKSDGLNSMLISIGENDTDIKFWEVFTQKIISKISVESSPIQIEINRDSDIVIASLQNGNVIAIDKSLIKIVREFNVTKDKDTISDITISRNAKWILTACKKGVKIFDILSGNIIEWVEFDKTPLSVSISPNNQYIAVSFNEDKGIYLYVNRTMFVDYDDVVSVTSPIHIDISLYKIKRRKTRSEMSSVKEEEDTPMKKNEEAKITEENKSLITLSNENNVKYRILSNIEIIAEKNKAKTSEDKSKAKAPFFLFNIDDVINGELPMKKPKQKDAEITNNQEYLNIIKNYSHFKNEKTVNEKEIKNDFVLNKLVTMYIEKKISSAMITSFLNRLSPVVSDLEIRSLDPMISLNEKTMEGFAMYLKEEIIESSANFEMVQAYYNRFINIFTEEILNRKELKEILKEIEKGIENKFTKINDMYRNTMCLISYFGKIQI